MDPLSVAASITGILAVCAKVTTTLTDFIKRNRDAPRSMTTVAQEISDLSICIVQLQPFVKGTKQTSRSQRAAISVEQVVVIITSCVLSLSNVEEILDSCRNDQSMPPFDRLRWVRQESRINELMTRFRASRASLNLIRTIFNT